MPVLDLFYSDYKQSFLKRLAADVIPQYEFKPYERKPRELSEEALSSFWFNPAVPNADTEVANIFNRLTELHNSVSQIEGQTATIKKVADTQIKTLRTQTGYDQKEMEIQNLVKQLAVIAGLTNQVGTVLYRLEQKFGQIQRKQEVLYKMSPEEKLSEGYSFLKQQFPDILHKLNEHLSQLEEGRKANGIVLEKIKASTVRGPKLAQFNQMDPLDQFIRNLLDMLTYYNDVLVNVGEPLAVAAKKEQ